MPNANINIRDVPFIIKNGIHVHCTCIFYDDFDSSQKEIRIAAMKTTLLKIYDCI